MRLPLPRLLFLSLVVLAGVRCSDESAIGPGDVVAIIMAPDSLGVDVGGVAVVRAFPVDADTAFLPRKHPSWTSGDPNVVTVDDTGGVVGVGEGTTTVTATVDGVSGVATVTAAAPQLSFGVDSAQLDSYELSPDPSALNISVRTLRTLQLSGLAVGSIVYDAGANGWLTASLNQASTPATLSLTANGGSLAAGTYRAVVPVSSTNPGTPVAELIAHLVVGPGPTIGFSQASLGLFAVPSGANPAPAPVGITNLGGGTLAGLSVGTITYGAGASDWITSASLNQATAPATLTIQAAVGSLVGGTYNATVPIASTSAVNSPLGLAVSFTITNQASILLSAATATATAPHLSANPGSTDIAITNGAGGTLGDLSTSVAYDPGATGWLNTSLSSTTAPATLTLSPVTGTLPIGSFTATVSVASPVAVNSPQPVTVTFQVRTSFANDVQPALAPANCSGCHSFFSIPSPWPHNQLVDYPACPAFPNDSVWVFPGDPNRSFMYRIVRGEVDPGCQDPFFQPMPPSGMSAASQTILRQWILDGAPNN